MVDRDNLADAIVGYLQAKAHVAGVTACLEQTEHGGPAYLEVHRDLNESQAVMRGYLHSLAFALYAEPGDCTAHEVFLERLDLAVASGFSAGWDRLPAEPDAPADVVPFRLADGTEGELVPPSWA